MKKGLLLAMALAFTLVSGTQEISATTKQETPVNVSVKAGDFSLKAPAIDDFAEVTLDGTIQTRAIIIKDSFRVKDLRGTQAGWKVNATASQFKSADGKLLPIGSMTLNKVNEIKQIHDGAGAPPVATQKGQVIVDNGAIEILKATEGTGMGIYDFGFKDSNALEISVDATTALAGKTYTSTITWDLIQAP